jgi:hypothetical protein
MELKKDEILKVIILGAPPSFLSHLFLNLLPTQKTISQMLIVVLSFIVGVPVGYGLLKIIYTAKKVKIKEVLMISGVLIIFFFSFVLRDCGGKGDFIFGFIFALLIVACIIWCIYICVTLSVISRIGAVLALLISIIFVDCRYIYPDHSPICKFGAILFLANIAVTFISLIAIRILTSIEIKLNLFNRNKLSKKALKKRYQRFQYTLFFATCFIVVILLIFLIYTSFHGITNAILKNEFIAFVISMLVWGLSVGFILGIRSLLKHFNIKPFEVDDLIDED